MANKWDYIADLRAAILRLHRCGAIYLGTMPVEEVAQGKTVWKGDVEVFDLVQHPKAKRAYAWARQEGDKDEKTRFVVVLELPPVDSPEAAVRASILSDAKEN